MSDQRQFTPEWRNETEWSNYPFSDDAVFRTDTGQELSTRDVLDLMIYPDPGVLPVLTRIVVTDTAVSFVFTDGAGRTVASGARPTGTGRTAVALQDPYGRAAGTLVTPPDAASGPAAWPVGTHALNAPVLANCVIPMPTAVEGFLTADGRYVSGHVILLGDDGVVVRPDPDPPPGREAVRIDIVGDPLFRRRVCIPQNRFDTPNFVRTINGVGPNEAGEFPLVVGHHLAADPVVRVETDRGNGRVTFKIVGRGVSS